MDAAWFLWNEGGGDENDGRAALRPASKLSISASGYTTRVLLW
jgi:hypothetical protein